MTSQYHQVWQAARRLREQLSVLYPDLFSLENPVPFKIGITNDLLARFPELPLAVVGRMMYWLTCRRPYHRVCVVGAKRFGLDGPDGFVNEHQADHSAKRLKNREKLLAHREAEKRARDRKLARAA